MKFLVATCVLAFLACSTQVQANFLVSTFRESVDNLVKRNLEAVQSRVNELHKNVDLNLDNLIAVAEAGPAHRTFVDNNLEKIRQILIQIREEKAQNPKLEVCEAMGEELNQQLHKLTKNIGYVNANRMAEIAQLAKPLKERADNIMLALKKYLQETEECTKADDETVFSRISCLTRVKLAAKWEILTQVTPFLLNSISFAARAGFSTTGYLSNVQGLDDSFYKAAEALEKVNKCREEASKVVVEN